MLVGSNGLQLQGQKWPTIKEAFTIVLAAGLLGVVWCGVKHEKQAGTCDDAEAPSLLSSVAPFSLVPLPDCADEQIHMVTASARMVPAQAAAAAAAYSSENATGVKEIEDCLNFLHSRVSV